MVEGISGLNIKNLAQTKDNRFDKIDQNGSGGIDKSELQSLVDRTGKGQKLLENFDRVDINGSGELDPSELKAIHDRVRQQNRLDRIDQNKSDGLNTGELQALFEKTGKGARLLENFDAIDADANGKITPDELSVFRGETKSEFGIPV